MAKTTSTKKTTETPVVSTSVSTSVVTSAPVEVSTSVPKAKKVTKKVAVAVDVSAPVVDASVVDVASAPEMDSSLETQSTEFVAKLHQITVSLSALKAEYKLLEKKWTRELKVAQKASAKSSRKSGNRKPSGFIKPTRISDELAGFLNKPVGSEMARTDVTKDITSYIRTNNLQDTQNGRQINPDSKLMSLLKIPSGEVLTYFNLQKFMSPHFAKAVKAEVPVAV
jgi:upstream activation factor subunit UAF30